VIESQHYSPSEWGKLFHTVTCPDGSPIDEILGAGAAGPGKSLVLLTDPLTQVKVEHERCEDKAHPYYQPWGMSSGKALHLRRNRPMLDESIDRAQRIFRSIDSGVHYSGAGGGGTPATTFTFSSGYKYQFSHCKDPSDWQQYMSNQFTWIGFDELVQFTKEQYENIAARCRSGDPVLRPMCKVRAMSNPVHIDAKGGDRLKLDNPYWVRDYFVKPAPEGKKIIRKKLTNRKGETKYWSRLYLPATLYDNPDADFVEDYERKLLGRSEYIQNALLYGDWFSVPGSYFGEYWNPRLHVCKSFKIPDHWPRFRSMDWGYKSQGCVGWWAMDDDGNLYCEREYNFKMKDAIQVAKDIKEIEQVLGLWDGRKSQLTGPADNQLWEERGDTGRTKAQDMLEVGIPWTKADKKSRKVNGIRMLNRMRDHHDGSTIPGIVFFEQCRQSIMTIPAIGTDPANPEYPEDGGEDHWLDMALYACAYASHGSRGIPSRRKKDEWADDRYFESTVRSDRGQYGYGGF